MPTLRKIIPTNPKSTTTMKDSLVGAVVLHTCGKNGITKLTTCTADVNGGGYIKVAYKQNGVRFSELLFVHDAESMHKTKNIYEHCQKRRGNYVPSFVQLRNSNGKYYKVKFDDAHNPVETNEVVDLVVTTEEEGLVGVGNTVSGGASSATAGDTTEESPSSSSSDEDGIDLSTPAQKRQKKSTKNEGDTSAKKSRGKSGAGGAAAFGNNKQNHLDNVGKKEEEVMAHNDAVSCVKKRKADDDTEEMLGGVDNGRDQVDVSIIVSNDCLFYI